MLTKTALHLVNHLLNDEVWARTCLKPFAGQAASFTLGTLSIPVRITEAGLFESANHSAGIAVSIALPANAPLLSLTDRPSLLAAIQITGSAEFAEALGFVFRNLRWDTEDDLSRLVGDVVARRVVLGGKNLAHSHLQRAKNFAFNVAEYLTEESATLARRMDVAYFCSAVDSLQENCMQLEMRLRKLEAADSVK